MGLKSIKDVINMVYQQCSSYELLRGMNESHALKQTARDIESLYNKDFSFYCSVVSLLALEYYNVYQDEQDNYIIRLMEMASSKETFYTDITVNKVVIIDLVKNAYDSFELGSFYHYGDMYDALQRKLGKELYEKYHPDLETELNACIEFHKEEEILEKARTVKIKNPLEFLLFSKNLSYQVDNDNRVVECLAGYLKNLECGDLLLQRNIYAFLCETLYISLSSKKYSQSTYHLILKPIFERMRKTTPNEFLDRTVRNVASTQLMLHSFLHFDLSTYEEDYRNLSQDEKRLVKQYKDIASKKEIK